MENKNEVKQKMIGFLYEYYSISDSDNLRKLVDELLIVGLDDIEYTENEKGYEVCIYMYDRKMAHKLYMSRAILNGFKKYTIIPEQDYKFKSLAN